MSNVPVSVLEFLRDNSDAIAPQLHLIVWAIGILCIDHLLPASAKRSWSVFLSLFGLAIASAHLAALWSEGAGPAFYDQITLDSFARYFDAIFLIAAIATVLISYRYLDVERHQYCEYYALLLFAVSGMMFLAGALDLVSLFVGLELMSVSTYILVGFLRGRKRSNEASMKYFLLGAFSTGIILYGMSLLYGLTGTTNLAGIGEALGKAPAGGLAALAVFMVAAGFCFKVAAAPFHMWAPDAYEGAPTGVTAFMSVAVKAAAFAVFFRVFFTVFGGIRDVYLVPLAVVAMLTMTWGNVAAATQTNVKRMLAYSSISHAGYVLMGLVAGSDLGVTAAAVYLMAYTFMNLGAWTVLILLRREDISGEGVEDFNGLFTKRPWVAAVMLVFLLSLAGIPPLGGFIAKYFVFAAVIQAAQDPTQTTLMAVLAVVGALNAVVSLYYYLRLVVAMFFETEAVPARLSFSTGIVLTLVFTAAMTLLLGIYPQPFIDLARTATLPLL